MRALLVQEPMRGAAHAEPMLRQMGLAVDRVASVEDGDAAMAVNGYDLLVVDLDAISERIEDLLSSARARATHMRVLVLGSREGIDEVAASLALGADDFLIKPLEAGELRLRLTRLSVRRTEAPAAVLECGPLQLHVSTGLVSLEGREVEITPRERAVLHILLRENGHAVGKDYIASRIFSMDSDAAPTAVETYISRLRRKLAHPHLQIRTVHGLGYLLVRTAATIAAILAWGWALSPPPGPALIRASLRQSAFPTSGPHTGPCVPAATQVQLALSTIFTRVRDHDEHANPGGNCRCGSVGAPACQVA